MDIKPSGKCSKLFLLSVILTFVWAIQYSESHPSSLLKTNKRDEDSTSANGFITLKNVERSPSTDGNNFTLRYTKHVDSINMHFHDNVNPPREPDSLVEEPNGDWVATFIVPRNPDSAVPLSVLISDADFNNMILLVMTGYGSGPYTQTIPELPEIHTNPDTEAVYDPHEDVFVSAFVPRNSEGEVIHDLRKIFTAVDLNTNEFSLDLESSSLFTLGTPEEISDRIQANLSIHTSTHPVSGYLQLVTDVLNTGGSLAIYIQVSKIITVKPSNQAGDFPDGFLTLVNINERQVSSTGNELRLCKVGEECLIDCYFMGQAISATGVKKVLPNGGLEDVLSAHVQIVTTSTSRGVYWTFQAEEDSGNSEGITTFRCSASDEAHGSEVSKLVDVLAFTEASIDEANSAIQIESDLNDPSRKRVTLTCAVKGRPLPEVTFSWHAFHIYSETPGQVDTTDENEAVATKVVTMDSSALDQAYRDFMAGCTLAPSCAIRRDLSVTYQEYTFGFPNPGGCK
ncbi:hypothetical protein PoB_002972300 [Plakobranchus ocellatus]|uniref:Ig-like domain-containing protein n=1 Tax=Plakobranchus ocellatus TaxID=259542 RepID=A0AAV4A7L4_9GAST|nr:hypothetical protein PoB_002972300 [Plakobranchus ocellatus]